MNMTDEVICGHLVPAEKKRLLAVYLDLMQEFDRLCDAAGITYWVSFGTLIGAVRHKGFIPWDDDVDIIMPRQDFDRLLQMTQTDFGAAEPYFLQNPVTDPTYHQTLIRFRRSDTSGIMDYDFQLFREQSRKTSYNMGICLSIFPLDNVPAGSFSFALRKKLAYILMGIDYRATRPAEEKPAAHRICRALQSLIGTQRSMDLIHRCFRIRGENKSGKLHCLSGFYEDDTVWSTDDFAGTVRMPFEDITVPVPVGYDHILRVGFGDYMQFPPPECRHEPHDGWLDPDVPYPVMLERLLHTADKA